MEIRDRRDELLLLVAVSGELPSGWTGAAVDSATYAAVLVTRLKKEGYITVRNRDGMKGYLLRARAKRYLLETYGGDVAPYLSGTGATCHVKTDPEKRLRLHRMSMVWVFCHRAGIRIFRSDKPELFPAVHQNPSDSSWDGSLGAYYGTMEWRLETDKEIKGSRACGILVSGQSYVVYNTMDSLMKWATKTERNLRSRLELRMKRSRKGELKGAIIMGNRMEMGKRLIMSDGGMKGTLFRLDDVYESIYYIPFVPEAMVQLWLLCNMEAQNRLHSFLCRALKHIKGDLFGLEAGTDSGGRRVYFCYLFDLWQIRRILGQPFRGGGGRVFCFTYQAQTLRELFPGTFSIEAIHPDKACRYLGWENGKEGKQDGGNPNLNGK